LLLHGRDAVALAEVYEAVKHGGARVVRLIHDLAVSSGVSDLIDQVGKNPLDLLVNNAGIAIVKPLDAQSRRPEAWQVLVCKDRCRAHFLTAASEPDPGSHCSL